MNSAIRKITEGKKVLILGFGKEGLSTYRAIRANDIDFRIAIADENSEPKIPINIKEDKNIHWHLGPSCYADMSQYDIIIKSPGIPLRKLAGIPKSKITSQTDIFLNQYFSQTIGITGTKGKSTTATLIYHLLKHSGRDTILVGNIGVPPLDYLGRISKETIVVMELSAHQGEIIHHAPHTMLLLNIFQEHLDHFGSYERYQQAKLNFHNKQITGDNFIFHDEDNITRQQIIQKEGISYFPVSIAHATVGTWYDHGTFRLAAGEEQITIEEKNRPLKGMHNNINICAALTAGYIYGLSTEEQSSGLQSFTPLEHRLEFVDTVQGITFYNDSISTIPEATIAAIEALGNVGTVIIGGFDRGIDYSGLAKYLLSSRIRNILLMGEAGSRVQRLLQNVDSSHQLIYIESLEVGISKAFEVTPVGSICLLSPAASSYDCYKNFEERGRKFKALVRDKK